MRLLKVVCFILFVLAYPFVKGQVAKNTDNKKCEANYDGQYCWGVNMKMAKEKHALYTDALTVEDYEATMQPLDWLLTNAPNLNEAIYIHAAKIYTKLEKSALDDQKIVYQDKLLAIYQQRIAYFGKEDKVNQMIGYKYYPFMAKRAATNWTNVFNFYLKQLNITQMKVPRSSVIYFMQSLRKMGKSKTIALDELMDYYALASDIIEHHIDQEAADQAKWLKAQQITENAFTELAGDRIDCEFIKKHWTERLDTHPKDTKHAKKVIRFMYANKCLKEPLFLRALEQLTEQQPSLKLLNLLISQYTNLERHEELEKALLKKITLAKQEENKAEEAGAYLKLGRLKIKQNQKSEARTCFLKVGELDVQQAKKAYTLIGDLYMGSQADCYVNVGGNVVKDKALFYAAYAMYQKAGNAVGMKNAAAQFPEMEDIFQLGYEEGDLIQVTCWIGGRYPIQKRP